MKTIDVFYVKEQDCYILGHQGHYTLTAPSEISYDWITKYTCILPEGYCIFENKYHTDLCIYDNKNEHCPVVPGYDEKPMLWNPKSQKYTKLAIV